MMLTRETILQALNAIKLEDGGQGLADARLISSVTVRPDGQVGFLITIAPEAARRLAWLQGACEERVKNIPGVTGVTAVLTAEHTGGPPLPGSSAPGQTPPRARAQWNREPLPYVKRILAVASGKGGVGKSTVAVNLAHALNASGHKTGLLDADIYGPSLPRMLGLEGVPQVREGKIIPTLAYGIKAMSMGLLVGGDAALVWRGPQLSKALSQLLRGVEWGTKDDPLDILLLDMPPGTGDIHLSLAQQAPLDEAIIVTTPQDVAVADARKCIDMFHKLQVPVVGVIENMSGFVDPSGNVHAIFGSGGGRRLAESVRAPFLGEVPLITALREASDQGNRYADDRKIFYAIAQQIIIAN